MSSRNAADLHELVRPLHAAFIAKCQQAGIEILTTCTFRSGDEQDELYSHGRTAPGPIVTRARAGQSAHNNMKGGRSASLAFDMVPLRLGKAIWSTKGADGDLWQRIGQIGKDCGLEWAGDWKSFKEFPHMQLPNWKAHTGG